MYCNLDDSEKLIKDLYIDLRAKIKYWAEKTKQTAQARMGYVGQHLTSVVTGFEGGRSGARGKDLIISDTEYAEIKTCYRVDQLGKCLDCGSPVAGIEDVCPHCDSANVKRNEDSKWLIGIRHDEEFDAILDPKYYYLVLFDFVDLSNPETVRASIWRVNPNVPGFALCMVDYNMNIRKKSISKAPFNLWPYQLKFDIMRPHLIYRSLIKADDTIETVLFPGRDDAILRPLQELSAYSRSQNLTKDKIILFADSLRIDVNMQKSKKKILQTLSSGIRERGFDTTFVADQLAFALYLTEVRPHIQNLPSKLKDKIQKLIE